MTNFNESTPETGTELARSTTEVTNKNPIPLALERFLRGLEDLSDAAVVAGPAVGDWQLNAFKEQRKIIDKYIHAAADDPVTAINTNPHAASTLLKATQELERLRESKALVMMMRSLFIGIFSEYDVFIGNLLKAAYESKSELFKGLKREITLSDLLEFASVDAVKQDILDKEIDSFRRNSYVEQFAEMESKFDIKTLRGFPEWASFVEFGQRRNLLTHNGGLCSEQYLAVCDKAGYVFSERPKPGQDLMPTGKYFGNALFIVAKVAFMLTYTLWRKLFPDDIEEIDSSMNNTIYEALSKEKWRRAAEFGKFGLSEPMCKKTSDINRRVRVINTAIGLKQRKKNDEVSQLLKSMDWSASIRDFKLAIHVLSDDFLAAAEVMRSIGKKGEMVSRFSYHSWPLFHDARDNLEFQKAYEEIYGVPFIEEATKEAQAKANEEDLDTTSTSFDSAVPQLSVEVENAVPENSAAADGQNGGGEAAAVEKNGVGPKDQGDVLQTETGTEVQSSSETKAGVKPGRTSKRASVPQARTTRKQVIKE